MLWLDSLERQVHTAALVAGMAKAAGAENVDVPDWDQIRRDFDVELAREPVDMADDDRAVMLQALGLR